MLAHFRSAQPTFVASTTDDSRTFSFVNVQRPEEMKQRARRSLIRRHAKRDIDRLKAQKHRLTIEHLAGSAPAVTPPVHSTEHEQATHETGNRTLSPASMAMVLEQGDNEWMPSSLDFLTPLGAGRGLVPFATYPVKTTPRMIQLFDYMMYTELPKKQPMRLLWVSIAMLDRDSFNITMAIASNMLGRENGEQHETTEAMQYYTASVQSISKRLLHPHEGIKDTVLGTVLGLACLDISYQNWQRWQAHMAGVHQILLSRSGGLETLQASEDISVMAFWTEISGSLVLDRAPRLPVSIYVRPTMTRSSDAELEEFKNTWNLQTTSLSELGRQLAMLDNIGRQIDNSEQGTDASQRQTIIANDLNPVAHSVLSLPRLAPDLDSATNSTDVLIHEALRLSALLFVGLIREHFETSPTGVHENAERLQSLLLNDKSLWEGHLGLQIWVSTLAASAAESRRADLGARLLVLAQFLNMSGWSDVLSIAKGFVWSRRVMGSRIAKIEAEMQNAFDQ